MIQWFSNLRASGALHCPSDSEGMIWLKPFVMMKPPVKHGRSPEMSPGPWSFWGPSGDGGPLCGSERGHDQRSVRGRGQIEALGRRAAVNVAAVLVNKLGFGCLHPRICSWSLRKLTLGAIFVDLAFCQCSPSWRRLSKANGQNSMSRISIFNVPRKLVQSSPIFISRPDCRDWDGRDWSNLREDWSRQSTGGLVHVAQWPGSRWWIFVGC